jgi:hypothetical protein
MNSIYDETYMGGYRTPFNTILERGVRSKRTTVEASTVVFNDVKCQEKEELAFGSRMTQENKRIERIYI